MRRALAALALLAAAPTAAVAAGDPTRPGTLDRTYGKDGIVRTLLARGKFAEIVPQSTAVRPDGRLLVLTENSLLARLTANGKLDRSFGDNGVWNFRNLAGDGNDGIHDMTVDAAGRITLAGNRRLNELAVARLTPDGLIDPMFNGSQMAFVGATAPPYWQSLAVLPDGSIRIASPGQYFNTTNLTGLTAAGALDTSFGTDGRTTVPVANTGSGPPQLIALRSGAVRGISTPGYGSSHATFWGVTAQGTPDPAVGKNGTRALGLGMVPSALTVAPGERLLVTGSSAGRTLVAELTADGRPITGFGANGVTRLPRTLGNYAGEAHVGPGGHIAVATTTPGARFRTILHMGVAYLHADGSLDRGFGHGGVSILTRPNREARALASSVGFDAAGRLLLIGSMGDGLSSIRDDFGVDRLLVARLRTRRADFAVSAKWRVDRHGIATFTASCRNRVRRCRATIRQGVRRRDYVLRRLSRDTMFFRVGAASRPGRHAVIRRIVVTMRDGANRHRVSDVYVRRVALVAQH